jgi:hypothetical protein
MNKEKEVNFTDLYLKAYLFFKRRLLIILITIFIGLIAGFIHYKIAKQSFRYKVLISSEFVNKSLLYEPLFPILSDDNVIKENSFVDYFKLEESEKYFASGAQVDTISIRNAVLISFSFTDTTNVSVVRNTLQHFYKNNTRLSSSIKQQRKQAQDLHNLLEKELKEINNFQDEVLKQIDNSQASPGLISISGSYEEVVAISQMLQELETKINQPQDINLVWSMNFIKNGKSLLKYLFIYGFLMAVMGFLLALWVDLHKRALHQLKNNAS